MHCSKCDTEKPLKDFTVSSRLHSIIVGQCKVCYNAYRAKRRKISGRCTGCDSAKPEPGRTKCMRCLEHHTDWRIRNKNKCLLYATRARTKLKQEVINAY